MNFLFFKPSLAPLEAELAPFKDWEEIGDIWEFSKLKYKILVELSHNHHNHHHHRSDWMGLSECRVVQEMLPIKEWMFNKREDNDVMSQDWEDEGVVIHCPVHNKWLIHCSWLILCPKNPKSNVIKDIKLSWMRSRWTDVMSHKFLFHRYSKNTDCIFDI